MDVVVVCFVAVVFLGFFFFFFFLGGGGGLSVCLFGEFCLFLSFFLNKRRPPVCSYGWSRNQCCFRHPLNRGKISKYF